MVRHPRPIPTLLIAASLLTVVALPLPAPAEETCRDLRQQNTHAQTDPCDSDDPCPSPDECVPMPCDDPGCPIDDTCADPDCLPDPDAEPACSDGVDNDGDGLVDHPLDPACLHPADPSERHPACAQEDCGTDLTAGLLMTQHPTLRAVECKGVYSTETEISGDLHVEAERSVNELEADASGSIRESQTVHWSYSCSAGALSLPAVAVADDPTDRERELHIQVQDEEGTWNTVRYCPYRTIEEPFKDRCYRQYEPETGGGTKTYKSPSDGTKTRPSRAEVCIKTPEEGVRALEKSRIDVPPVMDFSLYLFEVQVEGWAHFDEACKTVDIGWGKVDGKECRIAPDLLQPVLCGTQSSLEPSTAPVHA